jgi:hypothetical protein
MHEKTILSILYLVSNAQRGKNADSISNKKDEKDNNDIEWGKQYATTKLINIIGTIII